MGAPKGHAPYNTKGEGGRPVIYDDEFIERECDAFEAWMADEESDAIFLTEFASSRGYSRKRLPEFAEKSKRFADVLEIAKEWQEHKLTKGAMTRAYDSGFTKFVMPRVCGAQWKETKDVNITTNGPVPPWIEEAEGKSKDLISG